MQIHLFNAGYQPGISKLDNKIFILFFSAAMLCFSCNSGGETGATNQPGHNASYADSNLKTVSEAATKLVDPDSSDNEPATDYPPNSFAVLTQEKIRRQLHDLYRTEINQKTVPGDNRKFFFLEYDLNGDSANEILVGLSGSYFCEAEGCTVLLLDSAANMLNKFTVVKFPVLISDKKTSGWNDLVVEHGGKSHVLKFNGKRYPFNPKTQPVIEVPATHGYTRALNIFNEPYPKFSF